MDKRPPVYINKWLLPFSWLYGIGVFIRNKMFDWGILKEFEYDIPIICVGNITVGGTGKTPHTEYIVNLLRKQYEVAVLSRGYGRKKSGFILADNNSTSLEIGDEPYQIKQKFDNIIVAVDGNRRRGIGKLLKLENPPQIIILDDAFQHRYIRPSFIILLTDFNRLMYNDRLLPAGRLREPIRRVKNADMVVVTKCPIDLNVLDIRLLSHEANLFPYQDLYSTHFDYKRLRAVFDSDNTLDIEAIKNRHVLLVTGIASPKMIMTKLDEYTKRVETLCYSDHYMFKNSDIKNIKQKFESISSDDKIIITTEKDASRLFLFSDMDENLKKAMYYFPIEIAFFNEEQEKQFENRIKQHVKENTRNSRFYKK